MEQKLKQLLGEYVFTIVALQAEIEQLKEPLKPKTKGKK